MKRWSAAWGLVGILALGSAGCEDVQEIGHPISLEISVPATAVVGDTVRLAYQGKGRSMAGIIFAWGDGVVDSLTASGAQTADGERLHVYDTDGNFTIIATLEDAIEGSTAKSASITVDGS